MDKMAKKSTINNILQKENKPADEDEDKNVSYEDLLKKMKSKFSDKYNTDIPSSNPNELENLTMLVLLGEGSFGRVVLVKNKTNDKFYAMKIFEKVKIMKAKQLQHTLYEKKMLQSVNFPFIISLEFCMKDNAYLYFVLPFESGGDMFFHMSRMNKFDEELSKFYAAQVLLALEYLHCCDVLYRDLKPENIIISETGYLKLTDLGFCKVVKSRTWTFCGTPEYIAPELILSKGYGKSVDWWSFGVLIFEMNAGFSPFYAKDPMVIYEKITNGKYKEPMHFSLHLKDIIRNLLQVDMSKRFGNMKNGVEDIKKHAWFNNVDFLNIFFKRVQPPFVPTTAKPDDISNFDVKKVRPLKKSSQELFKEEFDLF